MHDVTTRFLRFSGSVVPIPDRPAPDPIELGKLDVLPIFVFEPGKRRLDPEQAAASLQHYRFCEKVRPFARAAGPAELEFAVEVQNGVPLLRNSLAEAQTLEVPHKPFASIVHLPAGEV